MKTWYKDFCGLVVHFFPNSHFCNPGFSAGCLSEEHIFQVLGTNPIPHPLHSSKFQVFWGWEMKGRGQQEVQTATNSWETTLSGQLLRNSSPLQRGRSISTSVAKSSDPWVSVSRDIQSVFSIALYHVLPRKICKQKCGHSNVVRWMFLKHLNSCPFYHEIFKRFQDWKVF